MAVEDEHARRKEAAMLPDERAVIAERAPTLDELDEADYLSVDELAAQLGDTED